MDNFPPYKKIKTKELKCYSNNSRKHSDDQIKLVANSIREFGFTAPLLIDGDGTILAGHARYFAAVRLGLKDVPAIDISHLSESQKKAYVIADNKIALNSSWDSQILKTEMSDLMSLEYDVDVLGFTEDEISEIFDDQTELKEKKETILPIKYTRVLISVPSDLSDMIKEHIDKIQQTGIAEIDYSGN